MKYPYDTCDYRRQIADEYDEPLKCDDCDIPQILRPETCENREQFHDFGYVILNVYFSVMSPVVQRNPNLTELAIVQHRKKFTQVELQQLFQGMNFIENKIQNHYKEKDTKDFGELP